jgi:hypothetical protein
MGTAVKPSNSGWAHSRQSLAGTEEQALGRKVEPCSMLDKEIESENTVGLKRLRITDSGVTVGIESAERRILEEIKRTYGLAGNIYFDALEEREPSSTYRGDLLLNTRIRLREPSGLLRIDQGPRRTPYRPTTNSVVADLGVLLGRKDGHAKPLTDIEPYPVSPRPHQLSRKRIPGRELCPRESRGASYHRVVKGNDVQTGTGQLFPDGIDNQAGAFAEMNSLGAWWCWFRQLSQHS